MHFDHAWQYCVDRGAHLLLIKDADENRKLAEFFWKDGNFGGAHELWLAYRYLDHSKLMTIECKNVS